LILLSGIRLVSVFLWMDWSYNFVFLWMNWSYNLYKEINRCTKRKQHQLAMHNIHNYLASTPRSPTNQPIYALCKNEKWPAHRGTSIIRWNYGTDRKEKPVGENKGEQSGALPSDPVQLILRLKRHFSSHPPDRTNAKQKFFSSCSRWKKEIAIVKLLSNCRLWRLIHSTSDWFGPNRLILP
jgi:hypothetical protein